MHVHIYSNDRPTFSVPHMYACTGTCILSTHVSAFCRTVLQLNSLHIASYLYFITTLEVGRDDVNMVNKIDARAKYKFKWYWPQSKDRVVLSLDPAGGARLPSGP